MPYITLLLNISLSPTATEIIFGRVLEGKNQTEKYITKWLRQYTKQIMKNVDIKFSVHGSFLD